MNLRRKGKERRNRSIQAREGWRKMERNYYRGVTRKRRREGLEISKPAMTVCGQLSPKGGGKEARKGKAVLSSGKKGIEKRKGKRTSFLTRLILWETAKRENSINHSQGEFWGILAQGCSQLR